MNSHDEVIARLTPMLDAPDLAQVHALLAIADAIAGTPTTDSQPVETWTEITRAQARDLDGDTILRIEHPCDVTSTGPKQWMEHGPEDAFFVRPDDAPPTNPDEALADLLDSELGSITNGREDYLRAARLIRAHIEQEDQP